MEKIGIYRITRISTYSLKIKYLINTYKLVNKLYTTKIKINQTVKNNRSISQMENSKIQIFQKGKEIS